MLYVYAITDHPEVPDVDGIHGAPLRAVRAGGIWAIVSEHDELRLDPAVEELWDHEQVVEAAMANGAVLPMRIGSVVADEDAVLALLEERGAAFAQILDRVRGAVELGIRVALSDEGGGRDEVAVGAGGPGTTYMLARLARKQRVEDVVARIHAPLRALSRDATPVSAPVQGGSATAAYLVDRADVSRFEERVEELAHDVGGSALTCTGPWPPYSFTREDPQ